MYRNKLLVFIIFPLLILTLFLLYFLNRTQINKATSSAFNRLETLKIDSSHTRRIKDGWGEEIPYILHFGTENFFTASGILTHDGLLEKDGKKYIRIYADNNNNPVIVNAILEDEQEQFVLFALDDSQIDFNEEQHQASVQTLNEILKKGDQVVLYIKLTDSEYETLQKEQPSEYSVSSFYGAAVITE